MVGEPGNVSLPAASHDVGYQSSIIGHSSALDTTNEVLQAKLFELKSTMIREPTLQLHNKKAPREPSTDIQYSSTGQSTSKV